MRPIKITTILRTQPQHQPGKTIQTYSKADDSNGHVPLQLLRLLG